MLQIQKRNQDWLPSIFDEFFFGNNSLQNGFNGYSNGYRPQMNITEDDKQYQIQVLAPGFAKDEANISLNKDELEISLQATDVKSGDEKSPKLKYIRREFVKRNYRQSFILPDEVDREKVAASLENGILNVILPKLEPKQEENLVRQITIC